MDDILDRAAQLFEVPREAIIGPGKTRRVVLARQAVAWALRRRYTYLSLVEIGERLGGRDHSTIVYAIQRAEQLAREDADYRERLRELVSGEPAAPRPPQRIVVPPSGGLWWHHLAALSRPLITPAA